AGKVEASIPVSALTRAGIPELLETIEKTLAQDARVFTVTVPHDAGAETGWLYGHAEVIERGEPDEAGTAYKVRVLPRHRTEFLERFAGRITAADSSD